MTRPVVSVTAERLYEALGVFQDGDEPQGWLLLKLCEAITRPAAEIESYAADTDTQVGWQPLLDPDLCPARALPWLAQMVGAVVPVGADEATARAIVTHSPGWARGTPAAVAAAAALWLSGAQKVILLERRGGDPYALEVRVYTAEVLDLAALTASVRAAIPAGLILTLTVLDGWIYSELEDRYVGKTYADLETDWAGKTYAQFEIEVP